jgi:hypothetical protein
MSEEHIVAIVSFEGALKREIKRLREKLKPAADEGVLSSNGFQFEITASGRILDGEVKVEYTLSEMYGDNRVHGRDTAAVTDEFLRRMGWNSVNKPLEIAFDKTRDPEIPF